MANASTISQVINVEHTVHSDNSISLELIGFNTAGTRVTIKLPHMETYMAVSVAEQCIEGIKEVRNRVERDLNMLRQGLGMGHKDQ